MNVFINTSAKVKQNKLTKQSKRYDDGFHDSDTQRIHRTTADVTQKKKNIYIHVFFTQSTPNEPTDTRDAPNEPVQSCRQRQKMSRKLFVMLVFFFVSMLSCCRFSSLYVVICVVWFASYAVTSACSRSCTPTNWTHMWKITSGTAHQNDTYAHKMTDFIETLLVALVNEEKSANNETD